MADGRFVGRDSELDGLRTAFGRVRAGHGCTAVISGEPGIGKTRLAKEFGRRVEAAGARVVWGRSHEGQWSPPLAPWSQALAHLTHDRQAPVDPVLVQAMPDLSPDGAPANDLVPLAAEGERFRLFDAVARLLIEHARSRPVVVVLDDIQWADQTSLELIRHIASVAPRYALMLIALHRTGVPDRAAYLSDVIGALRVDADTLFLPLAGLSAEDVERLVGAGTPFNSQLTASIAVQTSGNPFFVEEMIRNLVDAVPVTPSSVDGSLAIPEGIRVAVERRLARLSPAAQALLQQAAVFTSGFDFAVVQRLVDLGEEELLDAVDELLAAGLIEAVPGQFERYDFVHAIVRQALSDAWSPSRRVRMHRRAAEAMEAVHQNRLDAIAGELAVQYHLSQSLPGAIRGLPYAQQAVAGSRRKLAPHQVAIFLRIARDLATEADIATRAAILGELAIAEAETVEVEAAVLTLDDYLVQAEAAQLDRLQIAATLMAVARALKYSSYAEDRVWRPVVERGLKLVSADDGQIWARLSLLLDPVEPLSRDQIRVGRWLGFDPDVVRVLRESGDEDDAARSVESFDAASREETDEYLTRARGWSSPTAVMYGLTVAANHLQYRHGAFRDARRLWTELIELSERAGAIHWQQQATNQLTYLLIAEGDFAGAAETERISNELSHRLGPGQNPAAHRLEMATCRAVYGGGDWHELGTAWRAMMDDPALGPHDLSTLTGAFYGGLAAYCFACAGDVPTATALLGLLTPIIERMGPADSNHNGAVAFAAGAVWRIRAANLAPAYRRLTLELIEADIGDYPQTSIHLALGQMAALMNRRPEALNAFAEARRAVAANGQAPLTPVIDLTEAESLVLWGDASDYDRMLELIVAARHRFLEFQMAPWLQELEAVASEAENRFGGRRALPAGITDREADVLRLIARGLSDRQVGDELFVSPRTVNAHVRNMLSKTGAANRVELAMWARNAGIVTS